MSGDPSVRENKVRLYSDAQVIERYDVSRFGTGGGELVNNREIGACLGLLPSGLRTVIDAPIGTGRLSAVLSNRKLSVYGLDSSNGMIRAASKSLEGVKLTRGDIFDMPFQSKAFDASFCVRFTFHTDMLVDLFREEMRILREGGYLLFDSIRWSPKSIFWSSSANRLFRYSDSQISEALRNVGAEVLSKRLMFILPTYAYSILPHRLVRLLIKLEKAWPHSALNRVFWLVRKT